MKFYPEAAMERAMKIQEVILRALAKRITWWQAAEIMGISVRQMRRWKWRYEQHGYDGLYDRRRGQPFLSDSEGRGGRGPATADPGGPRAAGGGHPDDSGLLAAGPRQKRAEFRDLAGTSAPGV